jgi:hypothetical protein
MKRDAAAALASPRLLFKRRSVTAGSGWGRNPAVLGLD